MPISLIRSAMFLVNLTHNREQSELPSGDLILVGRGEQCDVRLDDPSASRVHCRLLSRGGKVTLTDAGSRWGTFVNGERVTECDLQPGDEITIGETVLRLAIKSTPEATTLARPSQVRRAGLNDNHPPLDPSPQSHPSPLREQPASPRSAQRLGRLQVADFLGESFADCQIQELISRTRSGLLFRAVRGGQSVALKLLHPESLADETARQRFHRGIDTAKNLRHTSLVDLYDGGIADGVPYAVSELVLGESVADMIPRIGVAGMLDWRTTLRIGRDIAAGLEFLEEQGVMHRNITPQHVLIRTADGAARLSGLLLSKPVDDCGPAVTNAGETVGELPYLSPEQVGSGQPVDHRSDIYQLGATLYALLTGRPPFEGRGPAEIIQQILTDSPAPPTQYHLAIPPQLEGTVKTLLEKRPADRFTAAADVSRALKRVQAFVDG